MSCKHFYLCAIAACPRTAYSMVYTAVGEWTMSETIHVKTRVLPGSRVEFSSNLLHEGQDGDVYVVPSSIQIGSVDSLVEFLSRLPEGPRSTDTWEEVERQLREERDSWDR